MAKFAKWVEWKAMARDISNALSHLAINENFDRAEFSWKPYDVEILANAAMPLGTRTITRAEYLDLGNFVVFSVRFDVEIDAGGTALRYLYVSLPFPYQIGQHQAFELSSRISTAPLEQGSGILGQNQWVSVEAPGTNWYPGTTPHVVVWGVYPKEPRYQYSDPLSPDAPTMSAAVAADWVTWTPTLSPTGSASFGSVTNTIAQYRRVGDLVTCFFSILFTPGTSAEATFKITLPVNHAGYDTSCGAGSVTNLTTTDKLVSIFYMESGTLDKVVVSNGPGPVFTNLTLGENYRVDGTFTYRSAHS